jgi:hypothetical protein
MAGLSGSCTPHVSWREGFITLMRESLDSVRAAQALLPNGPADVPDSH